MVRHGQGYSIYSHTQNDLDHELLTLVSTTEPVKLLRLRIKNRGSRARKLSLFAVAEWVLGPARETTRLQVSTHFDAQTGVMLAHNPFAQQPEAHAFLAASLPVVSVTGDRQELFGAGGSRARPAALERTALSNRTGVGLDPCGALQISLDLEPGGTVEVCVALGHAPSEAAARELAARFVRAEEVEQAYRGARPDVGRPVRDHDSHAGSELRPARESLVAVSGRRCAHLGTLGFYQSSGAFGFRDQLQDVLALLHARPDLAREHLLRAAARQFAEGDVQHWWHPETGEGVRTHCSDDLLFLPYAVAAYVRATGDVGLLDEQVPFLEERALKDDEDDLFGSPRHGDTPASIYEHCVRALTRGTTSGPHGLPKIGSGDWNDGMNRVGREGVGESIWLGWFLIRTLKDFAPVATARGDPHEYAAAWRAQAENVLQAVEEHGWDGAWYRRAYYDDGAPIGSRESQDCRIDAIAQSWSVIAGADPTRARHAVESSLSELVVEDERLMRLLDPPFTHAEHDPGYIRSYPPGVRENGGQYTHGVLWTVQALCMLGDGERAHRLFSLLSPVLHATNPAEVERYRVEPYVLAADVYSSAEHPGRGGWTWWHTGSAAWMYRIAVEQPSWACSAKASDSTSRLACHRAGPSSDVTYRYGKSELNLHCSRIRAVLRSGVRRLELDGQEITEKSLLAAGRRRSSPSRSRGCSVPRGSNEHAASSLAGHAAE